MSPEEKKKRSSFFYARPERNPNSSKTLSLPVDHHLIEVMIGTLYLWQNRKILQRHPSETSSNCDLIII